MTIQTEAEIRIQFLKGLQKVTNMIHSAANIDEIMLELTQSICQLFRADRMTIYTLAEDGKAIVSKVKTGLTSFADIKLPLADISIAGFAALQKRIVNVADVYDESELRRLGPKVQFLRQVDLKTGYRSKQMLVAPILDGVTQELRGVVQLINNLDNVPFGVVAVEGIQELTQTLAVAFAQKQKLAELQQQGLRGRYDGLLTRGFTAAQIEEAQKTARDSGMSPEAAMLTLPGVNLGMIGESLAAFFQRVYEPFKADRIKPADLLKNLKRDFLETSHWVPIEETQSGLVIAATDPGKVEAARLVNLIFPNRRIEYRVTTETEFLQILDHFYGATVDTGGSVSEILSGLDEDPEEAGADSGEDVSAASDNELVRLVNKIIIDAYQQNASDIHIEPRPGKDKVQIRFRKDGTLMNYIEVPASYRNALVARLKIMCELDISERRKPQDGKIKFKKFGPLDIELRVATIPTAGGVEDIVMRILAAGEPIKLDQLGLSPNNHKNLIKCIEKPYGLFFVCGPTGSGKTTTLHSVLGYLNTPETKIWTAEDPVEITQKGLRQVQINKKAGLDFATVMKAFLRADPDIIMVGEMRDAETTGIGIEASLTGHLVFATLHTNSAPESIIRLLDMGMDPFNFADALLGVLAQRLGKRLCKDCKQAYTPDDEEWQSLLSEYSEELLNTASWKQDRKAARERLEQEWKERFADNGRITLYRAGGCPACNNTGYRGRVGLHELLVGSDQVKKLIQERARVAEILACALDQDMRTLKMDGIEKVLQGVTDIKQVRAVCVK